MVLSLPECQLTRETGWERKKATQTGWPRGPLLYMPMMMCRMDGTKREDQATLRGHERPDAMDFPKQVEQLSHQW